MPVKDSILKGWWCCSHFIKELRRVIWGYPFVFVFINVGAIFYNLMASLCRLWIWAKLFPMYCQQGLKMDYLACQVSSSQISKGFLHLILIGYSIFILLSIKLILELIFGSKTGHLKILLPAFIKLVAWKCKVTNDNQLFFPTSTLKRHFSLCFFGFLSVCPNSSHRKLLNIIKCSWDFVKLN